MKCKKCQSSSYVKSGHIRGLQRYRCKDCGCQFTVTKPRGVPLLLKNLAIILYSHCGVSMLGIAKILKVSDVAVLKWIRKFSSNISLPQESAKIVQIDEMWHFVNGKKTLFGSAEPLMGCHVKLSDGNWVLVLTPILANLLKKLMIKNANL